jgi:hypothetical protein
MRIVVFGAGTGAISVAHKAFAECPNSIVYLLEPQPGKLDTHLKIELSDGSISHLEGISIVSQSEQVIGAVNILLLSNPYNTYPSFLKLIAPLVTSN